MSVVANRLATIASSGAAMLVLLLYAPVLHAPFLAPKFAALELTASIGFLAFRIARLDGEAPPWPRLLRLGIASVLAAILIAWLFAWRSTRGAPYAVDALARWGALFGLASAVSVLGTTRQRVLTGVTIGAGVVSVVGLLQHFEWLRMSIPVFSTPGSTFGNRNIAAEAIAMALPFGLGASAGVRSEARVVILSAVVLELMFLAVTRTRGAWFGATLGLVTTLVLSRRRWPRAWIALGSLAIVAAAALAAMPGRPNPHDSGDTKRYSGIVDVVRDSFDSRSTARRTRLGLWRRTMRMALDHPWVGVGPGNWPVVFPRYAEPGATRDGVLTATVAPRQAHNDLLQWTAETGVVGLVAFGLLVAVTALMVRRRLRREAEEGRSQTAASAGALVSLLALGAAGFPLEMPGTLALGGLALGLVAPEPADAEAKPSRSLWCVVPLIAAVGLVGVALWRAERSLLVSYWLGAAQRSVNGSDDSEETVRDLERALAVSKEDFPAHLRLARVLLNEQRRIESAESARRALAVEPYSSNAWAALAAAELEAGDRDAAKRDVSRALELLHDYPFALQVRRSAERQAGDLDSADKDRKALESLANGSPDRDTRLAAERILLEGGK